MHVLILGLSDNIGKEGSMSSLLMCLSFHEEPYSVQFGIINTGVFFVHARHV